MGFERRSMATKYRPQDGDTLEKIAEREAAAGNAVSAAEIARFNWGADDPETIDEHLRDELGCYKRGEDKRFVISADGEARSDLLIPSRFKRVGMATNRAHTLRVRKQPEPAEQFQGCAKISGVTFEFDKSFVRPSVVDDLAELESALAAHPEAKVMIFGHTDKVGSDGYNKGLSERRARSVYAFITNQPAIWEELYKKESWGTYAVQAILKDMGGPYDPGPVDGINGAKTKAAVKKFQGDYGLTVDGIAGPKSRNTLFTAYMAGKHDIEIDDGRFMDPKHMGCGELNPVVETDGPCEENRRVTFYLFNEKRLPNLPCKAGDLTPCKKQSAAPLPRHKEELHCSFYDSIARDCPCEKGGGGGTVVKPCKVGFLFPVAPFDDKNRHKQYVNVANQPGTDQGSLIRLKVGTQKDTGPTQRAVPFHVQVTFSKKNAEGDDRCQRNTPRCALKTTVGGADVLPDAAGVAKGQVSFAVGGGDAEFEIELGQAGGDECEVKIGMTPACDEATLKIVNWRKLHYQVTVPKGTPAPNMARQTGTLNAVWVEYQKYKDVELPVDSGPPGSWFPGDWIDEPGKRLINIGDHNKATFHAKFEDTHTPLGVHVLCCHTQYDCAAPSCFTNKVTTKIKASDTITWLDGSTVIGKTLSSVKEGLFPKSMKDGGDSFKNCKWKATTDAGQKGAIPLADLRVHNVGGSRQRRLSIRLTGDAEKWVKKAAGNEVEVDITYFAGKGPFLGESDGAKGFLQLIVIKMPDSSINDVMSHELGHTINQVIKSKPPGLEGTTHGRKYTGKGHQGPHCADGMSDDNFKNLASFKGHAECKCIMYGENSSQGSKSNGKFCARCTPFIRGEAMTTLH